MGRLGLGVLAFGMSFVIALTTIAYVFPYRPEPELRSLDKQRGWPVIVQFQQGISAEEENKFLCSFVYSACTASAHSFPPQIISITQTDSYELTIHTTTPEFQVDLLNRVKADERVQRAYVGFSVQ